MNFEPMAKVPRLSRMCTITEKLDGTNASVWIEAIPRSPYFTSAEDFDWPSYAVLDGIRYGLRAGARNCFITPEEDNHGFAAWVRDNVEELVKLGPGRHNGEWWGKTINRGYGLDEKRFSLFNVGRWSQPGTVHLCDVLSGVSPMPAPECCHVVPRLDMGDFDTGMVEESLDMLRTRGSFAAPGFMDPEGVVVWHHAAKHWFKKTLVGDDKGKAFGA